MTPAQIIGIIKILQDIITPEVWLQISKYFAETGNMPSEEKILEMHGDIHPPDWYDKRAIASTLQNEYIKNKPIVDALCEKLTPEPPKPMPVVTYRIVDDEDDRLKNAAKLSCNFWNHFLIPSGSIVVRLDTFYSNGYVIARAYMPYTLGNVTYGVVEFNTKYLYQFTPHQIAGTVIHEIGHTLGIGWDKWMGMFDKITGRFHNLDMYCETDYGPGTQYSHWDEERYNAELMTGIQDDAEYVTPATIQVMEMLGHKINECPAIDVPLNQILDDVEGVQFSRAGDIVDIVMDHFEPTEIWEEHYIKGGRV